MNIRDLEYLVALAEHRHFRRAADSCHVSQPTLSGQIRKLEDELGVMLLERTSRKVLFTQAGMLLVDQARTVLREVKVLKEMASQQGETMSGPLHIGLIPTVGPYLLPHIIPMLHQTFPKLEMYLHRSIEDYRLFWMEDPTPAENQECFRLIRQHTVTPIAVGEVFNSIWDCKQLIEEQLIDYIRTTITHAGGITGMRRIADFASLYQVRTGSHGPSDLSPVCHAAALHFDLWVPNFGVQEYMGYSEQMLEVFPHSWRFDEGYMHPGDEPGLGISFDEKLAAKYPYDPAYLPVARLEDGTLWNW